MRLSEKCFDCLYTKECAITKDESYLEDIRKLLTGWDVSKSAPYMEYCINKVYEEHFGLVRRYEGIKKEYNDLVLGSEAEIQSVLEKSDDSLKASMFMARIGNYIDFAALKDVNPDTFLELLFDYTVSNADEEAYRSFLKSCEKAETLVLVADNCGEIVLDRIFLVQLKERFPNLELSVIVRGSEVLNDATAEDAIYAGVDRVAEIFSNGGAIAGIEYDMLPEETKALLDGADIILSKGQGNYETLAGCGKHLFFSFLCKCDVFTEHFNVKRYTGMLIEEGA